jgi:5-methylcytosine-specific restriction endonuclease McrA
MKRGSPLRRLTPLTTRSPLVTRKPLAARTPLRAGGSRLRRTVLAQVSPARRAENQVRRDVVAALRAAQEATFGYTYCERCKRRGTVHGHEILARAHGGSITDPANIRLLCNPCNGWCEDDPPRAAWDGWKISGKHDRDPALLPGQVRDINGRIVVVRG